MSGITYNPQPGSVVHQACMFFKANPDEELDRVDFARKFGCAASSIDGLLAGAIAAQLLKKTRTTDGDHVVIAGPKLKNWAPPTAAAPSTASPGAPAKKTGRRIVLPPLDPDAIEVFSDVPLPIALPQRTQIYERAFDKLTKPGMSFSVAAEYRGALQRFAPAYAKRTQRAFAFRLSPDGKSIGVWRTK